MSHPLTTTSKTIWLRDALKHLIGLRPPEPKFDMVYIPPVRLSVRLPEIVEADIVAGYLSTLHRAVVHLRD